MIRLVYANRSNAGDWLSAQGIRSLLEPEPMTEHLCDEPFVADTLAALAARDQGDLLVIGGGGLLMDYFAPFWRGLLALRPLPRFCVWGAGICAWKHASCDLDPDLLGAIGRHSLLTVVRDDLTRQAITTAMGGDLPLPVPCPSLVAIETPAEPGSGVLHVDHFDLVGADGHARMDAIAREFAARTGRMVLATNNRLPAGDHEALLRILSRYAAADVVVTSRLHGAILALAHGRRVVAVAADQKLDAFLRAVGLEDWGLEPHQLDELAARLERIHDQRVPLQVLAAAREEHRRIAADVLRLSA